MRTLRNIIVLLALASPLLMTRDADACPNVTVPVFNQHVKKTKDAQAALDREDLATAKRTVGSVLKLKDVKGIIGWTGTKDWREVGPVYRRAVRIDALATSRDPKATEEERTRALHDFEDEVMRELSEREKSDPTLLADHAELQSRLPTRTGPALMVLRTLRDEDLLGSAHAFAALARLEKAAGKVDAEKDARERCRNAAVKKSICDA